MSLNVKPVDDSLDDLFNVSFLSNNDVIKGESNVALWRNGAWISEFLHTWDFQKMYQIYIQSAFVFKSTGYRFDRLGPIRPTWNWISFPGDQPVSLESVKYTEGFQVATDTEDADVIKSSRYVAKYTSTSGGYAWRGTLTQLVPGVGYQLHVRSGGGVVTF